LSEAFTPTADELAWARGKTQTDPHRLALVVWLKAYQRLGYFPRLEEIPPVVVDHVRHLVDVPDEVVLEHDADRTAKWHRGLVCTRAGIKYDAAKTRRIAEAAIREAVQTKDNPADLINVALQGLGYHLERATGGRRRAGRRQGHPGHRRLGGQALRLTPTRSR
jgi:hypothetical protein